MPRRALSVISLILIVASLWCTQAHALVSPVGVSLTPPAQFPPRGSSVVGARLNLILGVHESVMGFDLGTIGNLTDRAFGGIQIAGGFNRNKGPASIYVAQLGGLINWNLSRSDIIGIQATLGMNVNLGRSTLVGIGIGTLGNNSPQSAVAGAQIGGVNRAKQVFGLQVGLVNITESLHGIQIGLVNINKSGPLYFFPGINVGF